MNFFFFFFEKTKKKKKVIQTKFLCYGHMVLITFIIILVYILHSKNGSNFNIFLILNNFLTCYVLKIYHVSSR